MTTFKQILSSIWYVWNLRNLGQVLFIFVFGLFFLFGAAWYGTRNHLPSTPQFMDLASAHEMINGTTPRYIKLAAKPDFTRKIYRSGIWTPFWGNCPPDEFYEIDADEIDGMDLQRMQGCAITLSGRVDIGDTRTIWWPPGGSAENTRTVSLAPVKGTAEKVWIRSEVADGMQVDISAWQTGQSFSGVLATFDHMLDALPSDLSGYARQTLPSMPEAYVICPDTPYAGESLDFFVSHFWAPIENSDRIFLWTTAEEEENIGTVVEGVLVPLGLTDYETRNRCYAHFESVTGRPIPDRIGVIRYRTAMAYNDKLSGYSGAFMIFGVMWTVFGLSGMILYIKAPDWIYGSWRRSWHQLTTGLPIPRKRAGRAGKQPPDLSDDKDPSSGIEPAGRSVFMPSESLEPPQPAITPAMRMAGLFKSLQNRDSGEKELYLAFIQDFGHPNNPDSGMIMIGCDEDMKTVEDELFRSGQRYPGVAIHLRGVNGIPLSPGNRQAPPALMAFDLRAGDFVMLSHAPSRYTIQRTVITGVFDGLEKNAPEKATESLVLQPVFTLLGRVFLIGDSENGPCQALTKKAGSSILLPPGR